MNSLLLVSRQGIFHSLSKLAKAHTGYSSTVTRYWVIGCVLALLSACATTRKTEPISRDASALTNWQASGRLAVSGADSGGSGSFTWSQRGTKATVHIRGPIGIGSLRLTVTEESMRISTANGDEFVASEAEQELATRLGASVPTKNLRYWLVGRAAPGEHEWKTAADTAALRQADWSIDYQKYAIADGVRLPMKLVATSGSAKVRIVIDKWKVE
jgi:outer membrane lipoprotein LolB